MSNRSGVWWGPGQVRCEGKSQLEWARHGVAWHVRRAGKRDVQRICNRCVVELIVGGADITDGKTMVCNVLKLVARNGYLEQGQRDNAQERRRAPLELPVVDS